MKKTKTILLTAIFTTLLFTSCKVVQVPKFTTSDNLLKIELNSSLEDVVKTLGCNPYNMLSSQVDGYTIYQYKYKMVERKVSPKMINARGGEIIGTEVYNPRQQDLLLFFKGGQLETFITTEGKNNSRSDIKLANTIYVITRDRDSYTLEVKESKTKSKESKTESKTASGFLKK